MTMHVLPGPTLISSLMPSGGGSLVSGDTIELSGHGLILDTDAVEYPVTLLNNNEPAHLELKNGGRIRLNGTLPTSICPWVDPANPLPESNYSAGLTANASAEIQLAFSGGLGGGPANLPTATRDGNFWGKCVSASGQTIVFDRDIALHSGDIIRCATTSDSYQVSAYDPITFTATFPSSVSASAGSVWFVVAGGVLINRVVSGAGNNGLFIQSDISCGTLNLFSTRTEGSSSTSFVGVSSNVCVFANRMCFAAGNASNYNGMFSTGVIAAVRQLATPNLFKNSAGYCTCKSNELLAGTYTLGDSRKKIVAVRLCLPTSFSLKAGQIVIAGETQYTASGTVSRVSRTDFPVDTDLPDAFYFSPTTPKDVPWRHEDYWVRKGETLRLSCRAMRGGDTSSARVAIGEMGEWWPADGMPVLAEWRCDGGQALEWQGGSLEWTNDTGEDCQVRVWSMATGEHGAYLRVWRATGGAM